ncbi:MAG: hydroxyectoine utilization dehydratase EutB [Pseudomonadota bacterium]
MIKLADFEKAKETISGAVQRTPLVPSVSLSSETGADIFLKLEHHQLTGSFKLRGASNAVANLTDEQKRCGVVGVSTGNHGRGLARACRIAGVKCIICMSNLVPQVKRDGIKLEGAEICIYGNSQDEAEVEAIRLVEEEGMVMIPPFDHPDVIAGQGTLGLEAFDQLPDMDCAVIPLSGGGLLAGVAGALKARNDKIKIIGVTMERGPAMVECIKAGHYVEVEEVPTLADSLGGGIGENNRYTFPMVRELVDEYILVSEQEIRDALRHAYFKERQIVEGGGSVAIASIISGKVKPEGKTVLFCCGGNIDMNLHQRIMAGEEVEAGEK